MNYVIRFPHSIDQPFELFTLAEGHDVIKHRWLDDLIDLEALPDIKQLFVLLPGQSISLLQATLPKMGAAELAEALPYAVEDDIAGDVDSMYIAKGEVAAETTTVAAINREEFLQLYHALKKLGLNVTAILPDCLAMHHKPGHWSIAFVEDAVLWRRDGQLGASFDIDQFELCWPMIVQSYGSQMPEAIDIIGDGEKHGHIFDQGFSSAITWHPSGSWLDAAELLKQPAINLLQGKYRLHTRLSRIKRRWLQCASVAVVCLLLVFGMNLGGYFYMHHQNLALIAEIQSAMTQAQLESKDPADARDLITERLGHFRSLQAQNTLIEMLQLVGPILHKDAHWQTESMDYSKARLTITLQEQGQASVQGLITQIENTGLKVQQLSSRGANNQVTLLVQRKA
ncbi:MAG: type II secretion system protein GspL [Coxiellaceae bacterium]|nr:type II secretion system protein GspL [Coxiellaceae bacterium]